MRAHLIDYIRSAFFGGGGLVASLLNIAGLVAGISLIAIFALTSQLDSASVAFSLALAFVLLLVTHYGTFVSYSHERGRREVFEKSIRVGASVGGWTMNHPDPGPDMSSLSLHVVWEIWVDKDVSTNAIALNVIYVYDRMWWQFWRRTHFPQAGIPPRGQDTTRYRKRILASDPQPFKDDGTFDYVASRSLPGDPHWLVELVLKFGMPECEYRVPVSIAQTLDEIAGRGTNPPL